MKIRAAVLSVVKVLAMSSGLVACGTRGNLRVDTPVVPYKAPDISEITGIPEPDEADGDGSASGTPESGK